MDGDPRAVLWAWAYAAIPLAYDAGRAAGVTALAEALAEVRAARALVPERRARTWEEQVADRAGPPRPGDWPGFERIPRAQWMAAYRALLDTWEPQAEKRAA